MYLACISAIVPLLLSTLNALAISMRMAVPELGSTAPNTHTSQVTQENCMACECVWGRGGGGGGGGGIKLHSPAHSQDLVC